LKATSGIEDAARCAYTLWKDIAYAVTETASMCRLRCCAMASAVGGCKAGIPCTLGFISFAKALRGWVTEQVGGGEVDAMYLFLEVKAWGEGLDGCSLTNVV
jgi:hypothetical protein